MVGWPMIAMIVEVLPAPFGPSNARTVPAATAMLTPSTARIGPYPQLRFSSRSIVGSLAKVRIADRTIVHDIARRAIGNDLALVEDDESPGDARDFREIMLDQDRRDAARVDAGDDVRL